MKYLIVENSLGYPSVVTFDDSLVHLFMAAGVTADKKHTVASAGTCHKVGNRWAAYGGSDSLKMSSDPKRDSLLLTLCLEKGLSGLDLQNHLTLLELDLMKKAGITPLDQLPNGDDDE